MEIIVWVFLGLTYQGGSVVIDNLKTEADCQSIARAWVKGRIIGNSQGTPQCIRVRKVVSP